MANTWQLQEAKSKLSEVVENALSRGPQIITRHGVETAVVMSYQGYRKLTLKKKSLAEIFAPLKGADVDLSRDDNPVRPSLEL
jgi:prevent-host-death family protein